MNKKKEVSKLIQMATMMSMLQISLLGADQGKEGFDKTCDDTADKIMKLLGVEDNEISTPVDSVEVVEQSK
jgi:hypothetical protein